ncbi:MAG: hypothetical protein QNJ38_15510 [Prochloraceae cyanobacterium]|nr:hypothetical protein [Prochloraceae cyanobacterium]
MPYLTYRKLDFLFEGFAVGYFEMSNFPEKEGCYCYSFYTGLGFYKMQQQLQKFGNARCYYDNRDKRIFFTVENSHNYGTLKLSNFEIVQRDWPCYDNKLTSKNLAALIVDELIDANIINKNDVQKAILITAEEIDVRKCLGDY